MTTKVRIELVEPNVYVEVWEETRNGTSLLATLTEKGDNHEDYIHQNRELVIKEMTLGGA